MTLKTDVTQRAGGGFVVTPQGRLDSVTAPDFEKTVDEILKEKVKTVILNLAQVDFLSSAGIRVIFKLQKGVLQNKGVVVVSKPQPQVARVLEIVRAMPKEQIFSDMEEADKYLAAIQEQEVAKLHPVQETNNVSETKNLRIALERRKDGAVVIYLTGRLDTVTAPDFEQTVDRLLAEKSFFVILNLEGVDFLSSAGIRVIFKLQKGVLKEKGVVVVSKPQPQVAKVLEIVRAVPAEQIFSDVEAADKYLALVQKKELEKVASVAVGKIAESVEKTNDNLKITIKPREPRGCTIWLEGRLDSLTSPDFEKAIDPILASEVKMIVLNLAGLEFLSSAGIRVIFKLQKGILGKKGVVVISKPQPQVERVLEIIRALPAEQVFASDEEADRYLAMIQREELEKQK